MKYPRLLTKGDTIGICAPSSGVSGELLSKRLDNAILNIKALGYNVIETASVRNSGKCVSADSATRFAPMDVFLDKYKQDGFIWTLESAEMSAANIYRALWQMRECGWFRYCNGIVFGRPDGYKDTQDFILIDALRQGLDGLDVPVIYDADIGHIPPQMQIVNGAIGTVEFDDGKATVRQNLRSGE